ncbi:ATP-dependent helicase HrpB [Cohnella thailandensis]|uniref:ATP-dependent helicase HrpB n=2 Tax=Cohnella thailandensis TaxID=557557 RepID=A0A841SY99_9BACL|nr:ATP-dependent helicase HrpB [Cohnella thailandensis]MBP1974386.1 ATP-dependent helicase HrpB [Cohnella thailandensis]
MAAQMPVEQAIPELREALRDHGSVVLVAEPGAGKTTRVPIALLNEPWLGGKKIVMLEPRKLAARNAARYMASTLGEKVGETVGYRVRMDTRVGPKTRIEVVTEGVLTRMLQSDPSLEEAGLVIFDEYHERSLQADLGLALALQCRSLFREDLRVAVMSATLEAEPVAMLLDGAPIVRSEGRMFPVETRYASRKAEGTIEAEAAAVVLRALAEQEEGDVLVFLPGAGEIRRVESRLRAALADRAVDVAPLHGSLPQEAQDRALAPSEAGRRKVVLSTAVAESSLTVQGVRIVVDSGLMRVPRFSPRTGMARLETLPVSRASADQRRGRAGRLAPGVCYRLWTEEENRHLAPVGTPEILAADLAGLALDLAVWGVDNPEDLAWLDPPSPAAYNQACELLTELGGLTEEGKLSPHGEQMARFGVHPRLAHMLLRSAPLGLIEEASLLAALLGERDLLKGDGARNADISLRVRALRDGGANVDERVRTRLLSEASELRRSLESIGAASAPPAKAAPVEDAWGVLLGFAYPDRIGRRRGPGRYTLSIGRGAELPGGQLLAQAEYLVVAELDDQGQEGRVQLAAALAEADLERHFASSIRLEETVRWDAEAQAVRAREVRRLGAIVLSERPLAKPSPEKVAEALLQGLRQEGLAMLPWSRSARQLQERGVFLAAHDPAWPDWSDAALLDTLEEWLGPYLGGMKSRSDLQRLNLTQALESSLTWELRSMLDREAPTHIAVPSGSRIPIDYSNPEAPFIAVRLQEMFGLPDTPRIAAGKVPLTVHLLSPAQRPVQVTRDLASFWSNAYFEVRKDLKGRYPKHYWPDDPMEATATRRVRPPGS